MANGSSSMDISVEEKVKAEASDVSEVTSAPANVNGEVSEALDDNEEATDPSSDPKEGEGNAILSQKLFAYMSWSVYKSISSFSSLFD